MVRSISQITRQCQQILRLEHTRAKIEGKKLICTYLLHNDMEALQIIKEHLGADLYSSLIKDLCQFLNTSNS